MQSAPWPTRKSRPVEENARALDHPGYLHACSAAPGDPSPPTSLGKLPLLIRQGLGRGLYPGEIFVICEMGTIRATSLHHFGRRARQHALAAAPVNAFPVRQQERDIKTPCPLLLRILETYPFMSISRRQAPPFDAFRGLLLFAGADSPGFGLVFGTALRAHCSALRGCSPR